MRTNNPLLFQVSGSVVSLLLFFNLLFGFALSVEAQTAMEVDGDLDVSEVFSVGIFATPFFNVAANGRVGIGTSTPNEMFTIDDNQGAIGMSCELPSRPDFLVPVKPLSRIFRAKFRGEIAHAGLLDEIDSPALHGGNSHGHIAVARKNDDRHVHAKFAEFRQHGQPVLAGHLDVKQDATGVCGFHNVKECDAIGIGLHAVARRAQHEAGGMTNGIVIVDQMDKLAVRHLPGPLR